MLTLRAWFFAIVWAGFISWFSTAEFSAESTSRFILPFLHWLLPRASPPTLQELHFLVRKCAHVAEYFILSLLLLRAIRGRRSGWRWNWALAAVAIALGYASLDEIHQSIVPGRTASPYDSMLDTAGAALAQMVWWLTSRVRAYRSLRVA